MRLLLVKLFLVIACSAVAADNGGVISGTVRLAGKIPSVPTYEVEHDAEVCGERIRSAQSLIIGTNQTVRDVVIYLGATVRNGSTNVPPIVLDQRNCEFIPRIQIAHGGGRLVLQNSDPVLHVVRIDALHGTNEPVSLLNIATPYAGFEKNFLLPTVAEPSLLRVIGDNGHPWMAAYIALLPHSWGALTDENGRFSIRGVPKGTYKLFAWHEVLGTKVREVKVPGDQKAVIDFEFATGQ